MCLVMAIIGEEKDIFEFVENDFVDMIDSVEKGSKELNIVITTNQIATSTAHTFHIKDRHAIRYTEMRDILKNINKDSDRYMSLMLFSRQQPEFEHNEPLYQQPIVHKQGSVLALHGTIYNDKELSKKYDLNIRVDTDLLIYLHDDISIDELQGNFILFENRGSLLNIYNRGGLGLYTLQYKSVAIFSTDVIRIGQSISTPILTSFLRYVPNNIVTVEQSKKQTMYYVLHSGGLDSTASIAYLKEKDKEADIVPIYFKWGSKAENAEIKTLEKQKQSGFINDYKVIDITNLFKEYLNLLNAIPRISVKDDNVYSDAEAETEQGLAYVPYRNTLFLTLLSALAEQDYIKNDKTIVPTLVIGANLSEAMSSAYNDNSQLFIEFMDKVIKLGGKESFPFSLIAPFKTKTKTEIFEELYKLDKKLPELVYNLSMSCYYPDREGNSCGKCGSCKLKDIAYKRFLKNINRI